MSLYKCPEHGEVAIYPYVSKSLSNKLKALALDIDQVQKLIVDFYDNDLLIHTLNYYFLKEETQGDQTHLIIRSEEDEKKLLGHLLPKFEGGGVCPKCFASFETKQNNN